MYNIKIVTVTLLLKLIDAKISITIDSNDFKSINYTGSETEVASDSDIELFFGKTSLKTAVKQHYGKKPSDVYFKSPTPWGDLYKIYKWEQVKKITTVKSARIMQLDKDPIIYTEDFVNDSDKTAKVNAGLTRNIENSIATRWSHSKELSLTQEFNYGVDLFSASTGLSFTSTWGKDEEKSETKTVGATTGVEVELKPGQSIVSKLMINSGFVEVGVVYKTFLRGNLAVNYKRSFNGHSFWAPQVQDVMKSAGISNEKLFTEVIRVGFNVDARLTVLDKDTGTPL